MNDKNGGNTLNGVGQVGGFSLTNPRIDGLSIPDLIAYRRMLMEIIDALIKGRGEYVFTHPVTIPITALMNDALKTIALIDKRVISTLETTYEYTQQRIDDEDLPF